MKVQDLLDRLGAVRQQHDGWLAHCPSHSDSQPSLRIAVTPAGKALVKCRAGCDTASVLDKVGLTFADLSGLTDIDTVTVAGERNAPLPVATIAALRAQLDAYDGLTAEAAEYALRRFGVDAASAQRLGLGTALDLPGGPRLVVPFCNPEGVALGFQARALDPQAKIRWYGPRNPEKGSWSRLGFFHGGSGWHEVIVCEGPSDALTAAAAGYDAIAVRGAALAGDELAREILAWTDGRALVLAGDGDTAGRSFSATLASTLTDLGATVRVLDMPDGLDLTDWRARDTDRFTDLLVRAIAEQSPVTTADALRRLRNENDFPLTDLGNAKYVAALAESQGTALRYIEEMGFLVLDGGVWIADRLDRSRALVHEAAVTVSGIGDGLIASANPNDTQAQADARRWQRWGQYCQSSRGIDSVLKEIKALPGVATRVEHLDAHPHLLAVANGVVDLRTGELLDHDPHLLLTKRLDFHYDSAATAPRWERFISEVMCADESMARYMQRLVGYGITGETSEQCFAVLWGSGANGKTVFTSTLTEVFDAISTTTPFSTFEARPSGGIPNDLAALRGARLVFASEGEADKPMAEALLKRLTGRDPVTARFLHKEFFSFKPNMLLFLATNNKPSFKGQDEGLWRRVKLVEWRRYFAPHERDHALFDRLMAEREGILAWAVRGAIDWYARGLEDPDPIVNATKEYRTTSDPLAGFLPGMFVMDPHAKRVLGKDLFEGYLSWADEENLKPTEIVTRRKFFAMLEERGLSKRAAKAGVAFDGVRRARPSDFPAVDDVPVEIEEPVAPLHASVPAVRLEEVLP